MALSGRPVKCQVPLWKIPFYYFFKLQSGGFSTFLTLSPVNNAMAFPTKLISDPTMG